MKRAIGDKNLLDKFIEDITNIIDKHCKYIVVSGFVAIAHGRTRATEDIDMIIEKLGPNEFAALHNDLLKGGFHCIQPGDAKELYETWLRKEESIRYVRRGSYAPPELELKFAKDELDTLQLATRQKFPLTGLGIWFSSIDMNIAFKEELLKDEKDMEDARHLRNVYKDEINETSINDIKKMIKRLRMKK